jgi:hypothetical protein
LSLGAFSTFTMLFGLQCYGEVVIIPGIQFIAMNLSLISDAKKEIPTFLQMKSFSIEHAKELETFAKNIDCYLLMEVIALIRRLESM